MVITVIMIERYRYLATFVCVATPPLRPQATRTPLHLAAQLNQAGAAYLLFDKGANADAKDKVTAHIREENQAISAGPSG